METWIWRYRNRKRIFLWWFYSVFAGFFFGVNTFFDCFIGMTGVKCPFSFVSIPFSDEDVAHGSMPTLLQWCNYHASDFTRKPHLFAENKWAIAIWPSGFKHQNFCFVCFFFNLFHYFQFISQLFLLNFIFNELIKTRVYLQTNFNDGGNKK